MLKEEMEMRIAICDDEKIALEQTCNIVKDVFDEMHLKYFIDVYMDANELLQNKDQYDIVFLDIELKDSDKNGVWVAKMIKRYYPESIIIFTTNYEEYIDEVIEKYAFRYWSKPIDRYRLKKSIAPILEKMQTIKVEIYESKRKFELPLRNIMYITPENKHCKIVTISNEYVVSDSYKEIKEKFPTRNFCECHGSYCVNLNNGCYIINVTPGTTFNLTDQAGRKVEEYYTELYRGFNSSVPEFITRKMRKANRELNYIDGNGNKTTQTEKCDCYKYHLEKGTVVTIDTIESTETYKLQVDEPQDGDIVFQQHENEGEYFIYSDAPEAITDNTLADYAPYAFIREEHLGKGKYTFMSWHLNYSSESAIMDVQLYSENAKIKVNAIGINAPQMDGWDEDWTSPQAILNMEYFKCEKLFKVKTNEYTNRLYGRIDEGYYTLNSKEGYSVWLQDIYNEKIYKNGYNDQILEYPRLPKYDDVVDNQMPFYIIFEFEVLEGEVVLNQMAYNNRENIMSIGENNAPYIGDGAFKGISNTPNEVISDFSYEIKGDEKYIPVRTFNLNNPLGYKSVFWESNVNPQQDATSDISISGVEDGNGNLYKYRVRDIATETELLKFRYVDNSKKDRYDYDTDDNVWYFDEFHDRNYSADSSIAGDVPNRLIATEAALNRYDTGQEVKFKLPIANYSVIETYNIKLKNATESTKTIEFILDSDSCEFLYLENLHKKPVMLSKGSYTRAQVMYYIVLEPNQEIEYKMKTGLFTANDGSIRNCFKIYEGEKDYGKDNKENPIQIVNNLHNYDDDWNYPQQ